MGNKARSLKVMSHRFEVDEVACATFEKNAIELYYALLQEVVSLSRADIVSASTLSGIPVGDLEIYQECPSQDLRELAKYSIKTIQLKLPKSLLESILLGGEGDIVDHMSFPLRRK